MHTYIYIYIEREREREIEERPKNIPLDPLRRQKVVRASFRTRRVPTAVRASFKQIVQTQQTRLKQK